MIAFNLAIVAAFAVALRSGKIPLGVPGEWEWQRLTTAPTALALLLAMGAILAFATFAAMGYRALSGRASKRREAAWLIGLVMASVLVQGAAQEGAPEGFGLAKWIIALFNEGSSGYYTVARRQMADPQRFLADYPSWIARQDALHVGTHPPGLFVASRAILGLTDAHPMLDKWVIELAPPSVSTAIRAMKGAELLPRSDAAALTLTGALTLLACSSTVVPLYLLARGSLPAPAAWASAALWPVVPSALLFQPTADTAFPLLSTSALALALWAGRVSPVRGGLLAVASGLVLAIGMFFTLAFLPVGLVVALILATNPGTSGRFRIGSIGATGLGFLVGTLAWWASTSANPFVIWWINQRNHGRFYVEYPRNYLAWLVVNPIELAISIGLPTMIWGLIGLRSPRSSESRVAWATLTVLAILTLSGKNLSEVARLWLPLMPALLVASGSGMVRLRVGAGSLGGSIALVGIEVLILEATIQVVYPITV